jgi:hypothetical protein
VYSRDAQEAAIWRPGSQQATNSYDDNINFGTLVYCFLPPETNTAGYRCGVPGEAERSQLTLMRHPERQWEEDSLNDRLDRGDVASGRWQTRLEATWGEWTPLCREEKTCWAIRPCRLSLIAPSSEKLPGTNSSEITGTFSITSECGRQCSWSVKRVFRRVHSV